MADVHEMADCGEHVIRGKLGAGLSDDDRVGPSPTPDVTLSPYPMCSEWSRQEVGRIFIQAML